MPNFIYGIAFGIFLIATYQNYHNNCEGIYFVDYFASVGEVQVCGLDFDKYELTLKEKQ